MHGGISPNAQRRRYEIEAGDFFTRSIISLIPATPARQFAVAPQCSTPLSTLSTHRMADVEKSSQSIQLIGVPVAASIRCAKHTLVTTPKGIASHDCFCLQ